MYWIENRICPKPLPSIIALSEHDGLIQQLGKPPRLTSPIRLVLPDSKPQLF
jgi:hypothetical protein